jgi:uncharacterized protein (DUF1684 family)
MDGRNALVSLAEWRREITELYASIRETPTSEWDEARREFRETRDHLFGEHPQTPLTGSDRSGFDGLRYYPYDPGYRVTGTLTHDVDPETFEVELRDDGTFRYRRIARTRFELAGRSLELSVYWVEGYGGGLFLPFGDRSNGEGSFGGGRYLYDGIKGADLGAGTDEIPLDFNFAYNPSCAYSDRWHCPLAPTENDLPVAIEAGERTFETADPPGGVTERTDV